MNSKFLSLVLSGICFSSLPLNCNGAEKKYMCLKKDEHIVIDMFDLDASVQNYENRFIADVAMSKLRRYLFEMNLDKVLRLKFKENEYLCGYYGKGTTIFVMDDVSNGKQPDERIPIAVVGHLVDNDTFIIDTFYCYYQIIQHINDPYFAIQGNCPNPRPNMPEDWIVNQYVMFCEVFPSAWQHFKSSGSKCEETMAFIDYNMAKAFCDKRSKINEQHIKTFFEVFLSQHKQIKRIVLPDTNPTRSEQICYAPLDLICKSLRTLGFNSSGFDKTDNTWFLSRS